jgi:hypothetical protein
MQRMATFIIKLMSINLIFDKEAAARGCTGSRRVGDTNSQGKGSNYLGGYVSS